MHAVITLLPPATPACSPAHIAPHTPPPGPPPLLSPRTRRFPPPPCAPQAAWKAVEYVKSGMVVGLGTGSTAAFAVDRIGQVPRCWCRVLSLAC